MNVLLAGSTGNLGNYLYNYLIRRGNDVQSCNRINPSGRSFDEELNHFQQVHFKPDYIINCTGKYLPDNHINAGTLLEDAILVTTSSLITANRIWKAPIVTFSSYFQYNSKAIPAYQKYIQYKTLSSDSFLRSSFVNNFSLTEFVLYDNYGGKRRTKFLESLIDHTTAQESFSISNPDNQINLVNISDIASIVDDCISSASEKKNGKFQIRHPRDYSLLDISRLVDKYSGLNSVVRTNNLESRIKNGYKLWDSEKNWPTNLVFQDLEEYISRYFITLRG